MSRWINSYLFKNSGKALFGGERLFSKAVPRGLWDVSRRLFSSVCICPPSPAVTNSLLFPGSDFWAHVMNGYSPSNDSTAWARWMPSRQLSQSVQGQYRWSVVQSPEYFAPVLPQTAHYLDRTNHWCPTNAEGDVNNWILDSRVSMCAPGWFGNCGVVWAVTMGHGKVLGRRKKIKLPPSDLGRSLISLEPQFAQPSNGADNFPTICEG